MRNPFLCKGSMRWYVNCSVGPYADRLAMIGTRLSRSHRLRCSVHLHIFQRYVPVATGIEILINFTCEWHVTLGVSEEILLWSFTLELLAVARDSFGPLGRQ